MQTLDNDRCHGCHSGGVKRWSDRFLPENKQILGLHLIGEPPVKEDAERNTDLIVPDMRASA